MKGIWKAADEARATAFKVEDAAREAFGGWVNRAVDACMSDGLDPDGPEYSALAAQMKRTGALRLGDAARFGNSGRSLEEAASEYAGNLGDAAAALSELAASARSAGAGALARLAEEYAGAAAALLAEL